MPGLTRGEAVVERPRGSARRGGDLTADEMMISLRGCLPDDPVESHRQLSIEREAQIDLPSVWSALDDP